MRGQKSRHRNARWQDGQKKVRREIEDFILYRVFAFLNDVEYNITCWTRFERKITSLDHEYQSGKMIGLWGFCPVFWRIAQNVNLWSRMLTPPISHLLLCLYVILMLQAWHSENANKPTVKRLNQRHVTIKKRKASDYGICKWIHRLAEARAHVSCSNMPGSPLSRRRTLAEELWRTNFPCWERD